jgi:hypothetical protein
VLADGLRHLVGLPGPARVLLTDDALQLRELTHHTRREIGLRKARGPAKHWSEAGRQPPARKPGQVREPLGLLEERAQLLLEHHAREQRETVLRAEPEIVAEVEVRVRQARPDNPLIAASDLRGIRARRIGHRDEVGHEAAVLRLHGEALLMTPDGRLHHLTRQVEIDAGEAADDRDRILHEMGDGLQRGPIDDGPGADRVRRSDHRLADGIAARLHVGQDERAREPVDPGRRLRQLDRRRVSEAVAIRRPPRADTGDPHGYHVTPPQRDDPSHGPAEPRLALAPAHLLREGKTGGETLQQPGQDFPCGLARFVTLSGEVFASLGLHRDQAVDGHALSPREPLGRLGESTLGVDARPLRWARHAYHLGRLGVREPLHDHGEAARRRVCVDGVEVEARLTEDPLRPGAQSRQDHGQLRRRELLCPDLEQEGSAHGIDGDFRRG